MRTGVRLGELSLPEGRIAGLCLRAGLSLRAEWRLGARLRRAEPVLRERWLLARVGLAWLRMAGCRA